MKRSRQPLLQPFRDRDRIVWRGQVVEQNRELIAAEARSGVGRPQVRGDPFGNTREQRVAEQVTQAVVYELEAVEIEEQRAVRQSGQRVVERGMTELAFQLLAFMDVGQRTDHAGGHAVRTADHQCTRQHPQVTAVAATDAVLELYPRGSALDVFFDCEEERLQIVLVNAAEPVVARIADHIGWAVDKLHPARGVEHLVLDEIPVPQAAARRLGRERVPLLAESDLLDESTLAFKRPLDLLALLFKRRQVRLVVESNRQQGCPLVQRLATGGDLAVDLADDAEQA